MKMIVDVDNYSEIARIVALLRNRSQRVTVRPFH